MNRLGFTELQILFLGIKGNGQFNEVDIENSSLIKLGTGRILDLLASLKDRKLISLRKDGGFAVTDLAKHTLWDEDIPLWVLILRLLEIKSFDIGEITHFLKRKEQEVFNELENLRKNHLVLMSPQRIDSKIVKTYEILPEGVEELKNAEIDGYKKNNIKEKIYKKTEIISLINQVAKATNNSDLIIEKRKEIHSKLYQIKKTLES